MTQPDESPEVDPEQNQAEGPEPAGEAAGWKGAVDSARQRFRQPSESLRPGLQQIREVGGRAAASAQDTAAWRGIQRSGELMSGADIRRFDEFTEAVTRVSVGLHHGQAELGERVALLEQEAAALRQFQAELARRLAAVERRLFITPENPDQADNRQ